MALTGTYERSIDAKNRVAIPKRLLQDFGEGNLESLFIAPGTERSLVLYSPAGFDALAQKLAERSGHQNFLRLFYSKAERADLDGQGRIRIPERLSEFAGLSKDAYLLGIQDHIEVWDRAIWDEYVARTSPRFDELAAEVFGQ